MIKAEKISTKIKLLGLLVAFITLGIVASNIYLNERNIKDALIMNMVGKERMLTQRIAKNIFYLYQIDSNDFKELDESIKEFEYALNSLKNGNASLGIQPAPNKDIQEQFRVIDVLWNSYIENVENFKLKLIENQKNNDLKLYVDSIYSLNNKLLENVDKLVTLYNVHVENKVLYTKYFQFGAIFVLISLFLYIHTKLKEIEAHVDLFINSIKELEKDPATQEIKPMLCCETESELVEVSQSINNFIKKVNSAMEFSVNAIEQSKYATNQLDDITTEFNKIIGNINDRAKMVEQLNKSEDMAIETTEDLICATKRLQELKNQLLKLKNNY